MLSQLADFAFVLPQLGLLLEFVLQRLKIYNLKEEKEKFTSLSLAFNDLYSSS